MELGSISDTSLQTPTRYSSNATTPIRQQTFEPEASGLRRESYRAEPSQSEDVEAMIRPKVEEDASPAHVADAIPSSLPPRNPPDNLNDHNTAAQPWFAPSWQSEPTALSFTGSAPSALPNDHPLARDMRAPPAMDRPASGLNLTSPALVGNYPMFNGATFGEATSRPTSQPGPPLYQNQGQDSSETQPTSSDAAMLNGMYSLLSGNIYNLQLPEYQHWLHNVSQNQPPYTGIPDIHPNSNFSAIPNQLPLGNYQGADAQGIPNGQWNNFDLGLNLDSALDVNGAMTDIWGMAPNNFE